MQSIQPTNLTTEELLRCAYMIGYDKLSVTWVAELCKRLADAKDARKTH